MDFDLIKRFFRQTDLKELWLDRLIEILISNPSMLHFGQELIHGDLQRLYYSLGNGHTHHISILKKIWNLQKCYS
jgi:hypothetical protein